jgi:hypothetical protein
MNAPHDMNGAALPPVEINLFPAPNGDIGAMFGDLAIAQGEFEEIEKNQTARIKNREGVFLYEFSYADMGEIIKKTRPALSKNGIAVVSIPTTRGKDGGHVLRTMLVHKSGARVESVLVIPSMRNDGQRDKESSVKDFGGYITYLRRYQVSAMLNVAADADLDSSHSGEGEDGERAGSDAPRIGAPPPTSAPFNPAEHPELAKATNLQQLNKAWLAIKEDKRPKFQAHYEARLEELTPPEDGKGF